MQEYFEINKLSFTILMHALYPVSHMLDEVYQKNIKWFVYINVMSLKMVLIILTDSKKTLEIQKLNIFLRYVS